MILLSYILITCKRMYWDKGLLWQSKNRICCYGTKIVLTSSNILLSQPTVNITSYFAHSVFLTNQTLSKFSPFILNVQCSFFKCFRFTRHCTCSLLANNKWPDMLHVESHTFILLFEIHDCFFNFSHLLYNIESNICCNF